VVGYRPSGKPWRESGNAIRLTGPALGEIHELLVFERPGQPEAPASFDKLAPGTVERILTGERANPKLTVVALGREGLVLGTPPGVEPLRYEVHLLRSGSGGQLAYEPKRVTRGLSRTPPPKWPLVINEPWVASISDDEVARWLVALSVCSPEVWQRPAGWRPIGRPLFADPELWAIPSH